jgi:hypothetical protein
LHRCQLVLRGWATEMGRQIQLVLSQDIDGKDLTAGQKLVG